MSAKIQTLADTQIRKLTSLHPLNPGHRRRRRRWFQQEADSWRNSLQCPSQRYDLLSLSSIILSSIRIRILRSLFAVVLLRKMRSCLAQPRAMSLLRISGNHNKGLILIILGHVAPRYISVLS
jgi:hypothetical protein